MQKIPKTQLDTKEHLSVMLNEAIEDLLQAKNKNIFIDATFGRGGHSQKLLQLLPPHTSLIGIDCDPLAFAAGEMLAAEDARFRMEQAFFSEIDTILHKHGKTQFDAALFDLGVSSPQLDSGEKGMSFQQDSPLDMRMNPLLGQSAAEFLAQVSEQELSRILFENANEQQSRKIAKAIIATRQKTAITSTRQLAQCIEKLLGREWGKKHPATKTFMALRMRVNQELEHTSKALKLCFDKLSLGGVLVVISFHSVEDRLVKNLLRDAVDSGRFAWLHKRLAPSQAEIFTNPRSRSAQLRSIQKIRL